MRTLEQALYDHELMVLRVIGEWWELDLIGADKGDTVKAVTQKLLSLDMSQELNYLPPEDAAAINDLIANGGKIPVAAFSRQHGDVRLMGPGKLEREEPWLDPISAAEALWYRGFLYRGFDEAAEDVMEFYYLPQELFAKFPQSTKAAPAVKPDLPTLTPSPEPEKTSGPVSTAVDDLATMLALAQTENLPPRSQNWSDYLLDPDRSRRSMLMTLAEESGLIKDTGKGLRPTRAAVSWLKQGRAAQLRFLADAWSSSAWNDLKRTPGLVCEGEGWQNDPIIARTTLFDALPRSESWFRLDDLVELIKRKEPDFQRPDGNYDTWYIRETESSVYLNGFGSWDKVEGRLIRYLVTGPCSWLGLLETGSDPDNVCFRLTPLALSWMAESPPQPDAVEVPVVVQPDGVILVPYNAGRDKRFQVARVSEAQPLESGRPYQYQMTPSSLERAQEQGINPERILSFLEEASGRPLPASVRRSVTRWSENGVEAKVQQVTVLRVRESQILETLRRNPKTRDYLGESIGELAVIVREGAWADLISATAQLGLLLDFDLES